MSKKVSPKATSDREASQKKKKHKTNRIYACAHKSNCTIKVHNIILTFLAETSGRISTLYAFLNESIIKKVITKVQQQQQQKKNLNSISEEREG